MDEDREIHVQNKPFNQMRNLTVGARSYFVINICFPVRWELVGSVSHCRAGAGVAVCSSHVSQIRDVGQGSSNVANCM